MRNPWDTARSHCSLHLRSSTHGATPLHRSVPGGSSPPVPTGEVVPVERAELLLQAEDAERQVRRGHDQEADAGGRGTSTSAQWPVVELDVPGVPPVPPGTAAAPHTHSTMKIFRSW